MRGVAELIARLGLHGFQACRRRGGLLQGRDRIRRSTVRLSGNYSGFLSLCQRQEGELAFASDDRTIGFGTYGAAENRLAFTGTPTVLKRSACSLAAAGSDHAVRFWDIATNPSSRIRGFLKSPHQADQWLSSKGLHYSACLFRYRHMYVDHFIVLISLSAARDSQRV